MGTLMFWFLLAHLFTGWSEWGGGPSWGWGAGSWRRSGWAEASTAGWLSSSEELSKFAVVDSGITVSVNSSDDGEELGLRSVVSLAREEGSEVVCVDASRVVSVD